MKFIKLESRGGNYLVVASNIAWLRTAENGQTSVGMVGGQPLLVVGSIEEVAEKILSSFGPEEAEPRQAKDASEPLCPVPPPPAPDLALKSSAPEPEPVLPEPSAAEPKPEREIIAAPQAAETVPAPPAPRSHKVSTATPAPARPRPRITGQRGMPLAERLALAQSAKIETGALPMASAPD
ncbi:MAG: hypothetical protein ACK4IS_00640 [Erythrobacter sp.]